MRVPNQKGQTLIEVLIAIGVMFIGMLGVLGLAQSNTNNERLGVDRLIATQLAREAVEVARSTRDTNFMQESMVPAPAVLDTWDKGITIELTKNGPACGTLNTDITTKVDVLTFNTTCSSDILSTPYQLKRDAVSGIYNHTTGTATKFFRKVSTRPLCLEGSNEVVRNECYNFVDRIGVEVRSEVAWNHFGAKKNVVLTELLYNWR